MRHLGITAIVALALTLAVVHADYIKEKPSFLKTCYISDPHFKECYTAIFQSLIQDWKNGILGIKSLGSLDPFHIKSVKIDHNAGGIQLHAILTEVVVNGLSNGIIKNIDVDFKKNTVTGVLVFPKARLVSKANVKGHLLALNLNGDGSLWLEPENIVIAVKADVKYYEKDGLIFTDVKKVQVDIRDIGDLRLNAQGVFGSKEIEESANILLNQSWRSLYEVFDETLEQVMGAIFYKYLKTMFDYVPATYFIGDLPKP